MKPSLKGWQTIAGLLDELEWLIDDTTPSQWRIFSRIYNTRSDAKRALKQVRDLVDAKANGEPD